jgi:hypothetical protein
MYTTIYTKVWINNDTHGELMFDIGVMQGCPSPIVMYIDEPKTYLDKIDKESPCLFNTVVAILRYMTILFYSLNQVQAYKKIWTSYMNIALLQVLSSQCSYD